MVRSPCTIPALCIRATADPTAYATRIATPSSLVPRGLDNAAGDAELLRNLQAELEESARGGMQEQQEKEQVEHSVPAQDAAEVEAELDLLGFSPTFDPPSTMSSAIAPIDRSRKPYPGTNINSS